jgi:hypothetical protein
MTITNPDSARQRIIGYMKLNTGTDVTASDLVRDLNIDRTLANTTLAGLKGKAGFSRIKIGVYRYDPTVPDSWVSGIKAKKRRNTKTANADAAVTTTSTTDAVLAMPKGFTEVGTLVKDDNGNFMVIRRIPTQAVRHLI